MKISVIYLICKSYPKLTILSQTGGQNSATSLIYKINRQKPTINVSFIPEFLSEFSDSCSC